MATLAVAVLTLLTMATLTLLTIAVLTLLTIALLTLLTMAAGEVRGRRAAAGPRVGCAWPAVGRRPRTAQGSSK